MGEKIVPANSRKTPPPGTRDIAMKIQFIKATMKLIPGDAVGILGRKELGGQDGMANLALVDLGQVPFSSFGGYLEDQLPVDS